MPALENLVHVGPVEAAGIEAGPLIGHGNCFFIKPQFQPGAGIPLFRIGKFSAPDLKNIHNLGAFTVNILITLLLALAFFNAMNALGQVVLTIALGLAAALLYVVLAFMLWRRVESELARHDFSIAPTVTDIGRPAED